MPKRSRRDRDPDPNVLASQIVRQATEEPEEDLRVVLDAAIAEGKDPAAVLLGRRGGRKGGPARAKKLSKKRRSEIAREAARARWKKRPS